MIENHVYENGKDGIPDPKPEVGEEYEDENGLRWTVMAVNDRYVEIYPAHTRHNERQYNISEFEDEFTRL